MRLRQLTTYLAESSEHDCDRHTHAVTVKYLKTTDAPTRVPGIIAGLLRVLAQYTDGLCALRKATDENLTTKGMVFHFSSKKKVEQFVGRIRMYLDKRSVVDCLKIT